MIFTQLLLVLLLLLAAVVAFQPPGVVPPGTRATTRRQLAQGGDISEWRDLVFENPPIVKQPPQQQQQQQEPTEPLREICVLPFPLTDVLLQGETKELCLYEERFHHLFEYATTHHAGIVAMGFMAPPSGLLQTMPLCEIEHYRTMEAATTDEDENDDNNRSAPQEPLYSSTGKSIMATIRVVGRATLQQIQNNEKTEPKDDEESSQMEKLYHDDYITAWCTELTDDNSHTSTSSSPAANAGVQNGKNILDVCNELADDIEEMFDSIITLKKKQDSTEAAARQQQQQEQDDDDDDDEVSASSSSSSFATAREAEKKENNVFSAATLRRMKLEAELDLVEDDDDDDNDDDDNDDDDSIDDEGDLKKILQKAFRVAKASDTQGYTIVSSSSTIASTDTNNEEEEENAMKSKKKKKQQRSIQDLTAMSWAYLNNDVWSNPNKDQEYGHILKYRLQALNVTNLLDRLVLIYKMMLEQRGELLNLDGDDKA